MNLLEALPSAWTPAHQAAENSRQASVNEFRETQRASGMNYLTIVAASTILEGAVSALILSVEKVALPVIACLAGVFVVLTGIFGGMAVHGVISYSDNPIRDVLSSIGKGAAIATIVALLVLTPLIFPEP